MLQKYYFFCTYTSIFPEKFTFSKKLIRVAYKLMLFSRISTLLSLPESMYLSIKNHKKHIKTSFFFKKIWSIQKKAVPLHAVLKEWYFLTHFQN